MSSCRKSMYLFPLDTLNSLSTTDLRVFISSRLHTANNMPDGTSDPNVVERIDYAMDMIHQARDILLARGVVFTDEDKSLMEFLCWD